MQIGAQVPGRRVRREVVDDHVQPGGKRQIVAGRAAAAGDHAEDREQEGQREPEQVDLEQPVEDRLAGASPLAREREAGGEQEERDAELLEIDRRRQRHGRRVGHMSVDDDAHAERLHPINEWIRPGRHPGSLRRLRRQAPRDARRVADDDHARRDAARHHRAGADHGRRADVGHHDRPFADPRVLADLDLTDPGRRRSASSGPGCPASGCRCR